MNKITLENVEFSSYKRNYISGSEDFEPTKEQITEFLKSRDFHAKFIDIWFDHIQKMWSWDART